MKKGNKIEVYFLTLAEDLYEYLAEESEGGGDCRKTSSDQLRSGRVKDIIVKKRISAPSNEILEKPRRIVIPGGDQFRRALTTKTAKNRNSWRFPLYLCEPEGFSFTVDDFGNEKESLNFP